MKKRHRFNRVGTALVLTAVMTISLFTFMLNRADAKTTGIRPSKSTYYVSCFGGYTTITILGGTGISNIEAHVGRSAIHWVGVKKNGQFSFTIDVYMRNFAPGVRTGQVEFVDKSTGERVFVRVVQTGR